MQRENTLELSHVFVETKLFAESASKFYGEDPKNSFRLEPGMFTSQITVEAFYYDLYSPSIAKMIILLQVKKI